jgi:hypothetical protein
VIGHGQRKIRSPHAASSNAKAFKGLRAGDFVDKMAVDENQACSVIALFHDMGVPDFFVQCLRCWHNKNAIEAIAAKSSEASSLALQRCKLYVY